MPELLIREQSRPNGQVEFLLDGVLDEHTIEELSQRCRIYRARNRNLVINLKNVRHVSREGRALLQKQFKPGELINIPPYMQIKA